MLGSLAFSGASRTVGMYWIEDGGSLVRRGSALRGKHLLPIELLPRWRSAPGYLCGGLALAAHLALLTHAARLRISETDAVRICLASSGLCWALFTAGPLILIRTPRALKVPVDRDGVSGRIRQLRRRPHIARFMLAHTPYTAGTQTVMIVAAIFGERAAVPVFSAPVIRRLLFSKLPSRTCCWSEGPNNGRISPSAPCVSAR
jgi:UMF1 family MFS transporter